MEHHLFAIAGVDALGKHTFIKRDPFTKGLTATYDPTDAIYIGKDTDVNNILEECKSLAVDSPVNYIKYTVKSNLNSVELYNRENVLCGEYTVH